MEPLHQRRKLSRLHSLAGAFASAIAGSNSLPNGFPDEEMRRIAEALRGLDGTDMPEERQVLLHAQAKLREAREVFRSGTDEDPNCFELERTQHALFGEVDALLGGIPRTELVPLQPSADGPALVVKRADIEPLAEALAQRIEAMRSASREAIVHIDQSRHLHVDMAIIKIGRDLRLKLDSLAKLAASFQAELNGHLINLDWVKHFTNGIAALADSIRGAVDGLKGAFNRSTELVDKIVRAHRLGERVVSGGRTLLQAIKRMLSREDTDHFLQPGQVFRDVADPWCPAMIVVPPGRFAVAGHSWEATVDRPFALGQYPVTYEEYDAFCEATGREKPFDHYWGRGRQPVVNVSWRDAVAYCDWLSRKTGRPYRLPDEFEWELACRAGTTTRYAFGDVISDEEANVVGSWRGTKEVGAYRPNAWGFYDMHGTVWEWTSSSWSFFGEGGGYWASRVEAGDPPAGRAVRGGSWRAEADAAVSSSREEVQPHELRSDLGFRVARDLVSRIG